MATEKNYRKTSTVEMMIGGELGNPSSFLSSSSSNGVVSPSPYYDPLGLPLHDDHRFVRNSSFGRASLPSEHSPSSSSSNGLFSYYDDGYPPFSAAFEDTPMHQTRTKTTTNRSSINGQWSNSNPINAYSDHDEVDDLGLSEIFYRMNIGDNKQEGRTKTRGFGMERDGFLLEDFDGFNVDMRLGQECYYVGDSRNSQMGCYSREVESMDPFARPFFADESDFVWSQSHGLDSNGGMGLRGGSLSPEVVQLMNLALNLNTPLRTKQNLRGRRGDLEGFSCEDSFIIEEKCLRKNSHNGHVRIPNVRDRSFGLVDCPSSYGGCYENGYGWSGELPFGSQPRYSSLLGTTDYMLMLAKDQDGCRHLQKLVDYGTYQDVQIIFRNVSNHVVELSTDPYGNYLVQKLLDVVSELQKWHIVRKMVWRPGQLVSISLNSYGTRVVQKLIETVKDTSLLSSVISALKPGFLELTMDLNGNHVLQRCLQCLSSEENTFIFDDAAENCVAMGTHKNGCCMLQKCIEHSTGNFRNKLVKEVLKNASLLAEDPYGNFVVQFLMEHIPSATAKLIPQFKDNFARLSMHKASSHVVEKFLKYFQYSHKIIVDELIKFGPFESLLQDPFANYVISTALDCTKGSVNRSLVQKIRSFLRTVPPGPYCKKIFSHPLVNN
ncbi:putative pumilio homolog 8, chloroplastic [Morus notabilis]|uniref:putative pumilio homolog 8, chloroplastic n=1 Tax=Morus notabilis TaxID=981085 RepID=UPI000CECF13C|nr:putative pumilio homolog 8, chloroplastic [Morus notabilis]